jgi:hypothetical protein
MKKRKPKIISDKKKRGEWAESVFMARAAEHGLPVSKPWGEMSSYDFVIGKTGRFVSVQVKSTICEEGTGYECTVRGGHKAYPAGAFDFLAAFVVPADAWYFIPLKLIRGKRSIMLHPDSQTGEYENYREAWHLLREAAEGGEASETSAEETTAPVAASGRFPRNAVERMEAAANFARRQIEGNYLRPQKEREDG